MPAEQRSRRTIWGIVLFAYWGILFVGTHLPLSGTPLPAPDSDKAVHIAAYALLAALLCGFACAGHRHYWRRMVLVFVALSVYGGLDEWLQALVPGRSPELADWTADLVGVVIGITVSVLVGARVDAVSPSCHQAPTADADRH